MRFCFFININLFFLNLLFFPFFFAIKKCTHLIYEKLKQDTWIIPFEAMIFTMLSFITINLSWVEDTIKNQPVTVYCPIHCLNIDESYSTITIIQCLLYKKIMQGISELEARKNFVFFCVIVIHVFHRQQFLYKKRFPCLFSSCHI